MIPCKADCTRLASTLFALLERNYEYIHVHVSGLVHIWLFESLK